MADKADVPGVPVPKSLRNKGIVSCSDNLADNQCLVVPGSLIWLFFEAELKARFVRKSDAATEAEFGLPK